MTVPASPLPNARQLFQALRAPAFTAEAWVKNFPGRVVRIYPSGRLSLAAGVKASARHSYREPITVWFPSYICNEALEPLRCMPLSLQFYSVLEDLSPDWSILEQRVASEKRLHVFVLVHYFGFPNATKSARDFCDRYRMTLLEDAAHMLLPIPGMGLGDYLVFSPRKLLPVPAGGILISVRGLEEKPAGALWKIPLAGETGRWLSRRVAQRILFSCHLPWHFLWKNGNGSRSAGDAADGAIGPENCDGFTLRLLSIMERGLEEVIERRRTHYLRFLDWSKQLDHCVPLFPALPEAVCPYAFPLLLEHVSKEMGKKLRSQGFPADQWPDLPPEVLAEPKRYGTAVDLHRRLLLLPLHQTLAAIEIDAMARALSASLGSNG